MRAWGNNTDRVLAALDELGPLTPSQLGEYLGLPQDTMSSLMAKLRLPKPGRRAVPKRVHIVRWVSGLPGKKNHLRPVYDLGGLPCAPKPEPLPKWLPKDRHQAQLARRGAATAAPTAT